MYFSFIIDNRECMKEKMDVLDKLDVAKASLEYFLKLRQKDAALDAYLLLSTSESESDNRIRSTWKSPNDSMHEALKYLNTAHPSMCHSVNDISSPCIALGQALFLIHLTRMTSQLDRFGHGRWTSFAEFWPIILFVNGSYRQSAQEKKNEKELSQMVSAWMTAATTNEAIPGASLYTEPIRWDQRLYILRFRSSSELELEPGAEPEADVYDKLVSEWHGFLFDIYTLKDAYSVIQWIAGSSNAGHPLTERGSQTSVLSSSFLNVRQCSFRIRLKSYRIPIVAVASVFDICLRPLFSCEPRWPFPEDYLPDPNIAKLNPRESIPTYWISIAPPMTLLDQFPTDQYVVHKGLEELAVDETVVYQIYCHRHMRKPTYLPFGRIEWAPGQKAWIVSVYPVVFSTLFELCQQYRTYQKQERVPESSYFERLGRYLFEVLPSYYFPNLRSTLVKLGLVALVPNKAPPPFPPFSIENELKAIRRAAAERLEKIQISTLSRMKQGEWKKRAFKTILTLDDIMNTSPTALPFLFRTMSSFLESCFRSDPESALETFRKHSVPIQAMGQYQERMNSVVPFRSPFDDEAELKRQEKFMFGNPFKRVPKVTKWMKQAQQENESKTASPTDEADKLYEAQNQIEDALNESFVEDVDIDMIHQDELDKTMFVSPLESVDKEQGHSLDVEDAGPDPDLNSDLEQGHDQTMVNEKEMSSDFKTAQELEAWLSCVYACIKNPGHANFLKFIELMKNLDRRMLSQSMKANLAREMSRYKRIRMIEYLLD